MLRKITCSDINLEMTYGTSIYIEIDFFKFTKEDDAKYIIVESENQGNYEVLDEIMLDQDITTHEELREKAVKWLFDKVVIE